MFNSIAAAILATIMAHAQAQAAITPSVQLTPVVPPKDSTVTYGESHGSMAGTIQCKPNTYVTAISASVSMGIRSLGFTCSDGSQTDCAGTCDQFPITAPFNNSGKPIAISNAATIQYSSMVSASGFDNLWINEKADVYSLKSRVDGIDQRIMSDDRSPSDRWYRWPTADDVASVPSGTRTVIVGMHWWKHNDIAAIKPIFASTTPYSPLPVPVAPAPVQLNFTLGLGSFESVAVFGHNDGDVKAFDCPDGAFIYTMTAVMKDDFTDLEFTCSDAAATKSECFGKCNSITTATQIGSNTINNKDNPALVTMTASNGFHELWVNSGYRATAMMSKDAWLGQSLLPDTFVSGGWGKWPNADDDKQFPGDKVITGVRIRSDNDINQFRPVFRMVSPPAAPQVPATPSSTTPDHATGGDSGTAASTDSSAIFNACQYKCTHDEGGDPHACADLCTNQVDGSQNPTFVFSQQQNGTQTLDQCKYVCKGAGVDDQTCLNRCQVLVQTSTAAPTSTPTPKTFEQCTSVCKQAGVNDQTCSNRCTELVYKTTVTLASSTTSEQPTQTPQTFDQCTYYCVGAGVDAKICSGTCSMLIYKTTTTPTQTDVQPTQTPNFQACQYKCTHDEGGDLHACSDKCLAQVYGSPLPSTKTVQSTPTSDLNQECLKKCYRVRVGLVCPDECSHHSKSSAVTSTTPCADAASSTAVPTTTPCTDATTTTSQCSVTQQITLTQYTVATNIHLPNLATTATTPTTSASIPVATHPVPPTPYGGTPAPYEGTPTPSSGTPAPSSGGDGYGTPPPPPSVPYGGQPQPQSPVPYCDEVDTKKYTPQPQDGTNVTGNTTSSNTTIQVNGTVTDGNNTASVTAGATVGESSSSSALNLMKLSAASVVATAILIVV